jgi:outer membrane protein insertion porin family
MSVGLRVRYGDKTREGRLSVKWRRPRGVPGSLLWVLGQESESLPGFDARRTGLGMQYSRGLGKRTTVQYRYDVADVVIEELDAAPEAIAANEGLLSGLGFGWTRDLRDDPLDASRGGLTTAQLAVNAEALGGDWNYVKLIGKRTWYRPLLRERLAYVLGVQAGAAWTFGGTGQVPISERLYSGGVDSVRGYRADRLGPLQPLTGERGGGESLFVLSQEVRYPARGRVAMAAFLDAGNVWRSASGFNPFDSRLTAGPGVFVRTPVGPFRLYYGWKLDPEPDEDPGRFNFAFGPSF